MSVYYEKQYIDKETNKEGNMFIEHENKSEENYVFIDEKYKEYFDNISDMFEEKVDYILKKHFKKNDPTNKNKLLCLNACVLWRKKFLQLLGKSLIEYDEYCKTNEKRNDETPQDIKDINKEKESDINKEEATKFKNESEKETSKESEKETKEVENVEKTNVQKQNEKNNNEKDLKSFIKNVKIVDNKNIEVIYDLNEANEDTRPCAELSTDEIYYLLVESKKSENEYKKKIFTFLKYLPLFIKSIENKSIMEKNILEEKLLNNSYDQNEIPNEGETSNINENISILEIKNKLDAIISFNCNLSDNLETVFNNGIDLINNDNNNNKSENFFQYNYDTLNEINNENEENYMNDHKNNDNLYESNMNDNNCSVIGQKTKTSNNSTDLKNFENISNKCFNQRTDKSVVLPLSRVNDLSMINNMNLKSNIGLNDDNNKNDSPFYIYKNDMNKLNVYGLDMLINLNNDLIYKINHVYSLIQFYTILAKDIFNDK
ncbi:conserved Plasmodium protein, unknown function [Plasmodium chabaudi adami]|uniref:Uncharacterized protein n=1 Tax=Plasmodium chabaudi adami TaxID=5826 RepID=A0A1D3LHT3_PLACE|nr:conserved Plasmodium protein, unknown function [Plasmodium chabaudi adami]